MKMRSRLIAVFAAAAALTATGAGVGLRYEEDKNDIPPDINAANQPYDVGGDTSAQKYMVAVAMKAYATQYPEDTTFTSPNWDPFRHAYISAKFAKFHGGFAARVFGDANELKPDNVDKAMDYYNNDKAIALWGDDPAVGDFNDVDLKLAAEVKAAITDGTLKLNLQDVPADYSHISVFLNADEGMTYVKHHPKETVAMAAGGIGLSAAAAGAAHHHRSKKSASNERAKAAAPQPA